MPPPSPQPKKPRLFRELHTGDVARGRPLLLRALDNRRRAAQARLFRRLPWRRRKICRLLSPSPRIQARSGAAIIGAALANQPCSRSGRNAAMASLHEAVVVSRSIAVRDLGRRADLADSLRLHLTTMYMRKKALDAVDEAICIWMQLSESEPSGTWGRSPTRSASPHFALPTSTTRTPPHARRTSVDLQRIRPRGTRRCI